MVALLNQLEDMGIPETAFPRAFYTRQVDTLEAQIAELTQARHHLTRAEASSLPPSPGPGLLPPPSLSLSLSLSRPVSSLLPPPSLSRLRLLPFPPSLSRFRSPPSSLSLSRPVSSLLPPSLPLPVSTSTSSLLPRSPGLQG
ncbi:hypothetical protein ACLB2K_016211 [Fragaria x ananassa]